MSACQLDCPTSSKNETQWTYGCIGRATAFVGGDGDSIPTSGALDKSAGLPPSLQSPPETLHPNRAFERMFPQDQVKVACATRSELDGLGAAALQVDGGCNLKHTRSLTGDGGSA